MYKNSAQEHFNFIYNFMKQTILFKLNIGLKHLSMNTSASILFGKRTKIVSACPSSPSRLQSTPSGAEETDSSTPGARETGLVSEADPPKHRESMPTVG